MLTTVEPASETASLRLNGSVARGAVDIAAVFDDDRSHVNDSLSFAEFSGVPAPD
jgi:hypothetical protein